jgi:hypothetical protein
MTISANTQPRQLEVRSIRAKALRLVMLAAIAGTIAVSSTACSVTTGEDRAGGVELSVDLSAVSTAVSAVVPAFQSVDASSSSSGLTRAVRLSITTDGATVTAEELDATLRAAYETMPSDYSGVGITFYSASAPSSILKLSEAVAALDVDGIDSLSAGPVYASAAALSTRYGS